MNFISSLPVIAGPSGPPQAQPGSEPSPGSSNAPPFKEVLNRARKQPPDEAELTLAAEMMAPVAGQSLVASNQVSAPGGQLPVTGVQPSVNGEQLLAVEMAGPEGIALPAGHPQPMSDLPIAPFPSLEMAAAPLLATPLPAASQAAIAPGPTLPGGDSMPAVTGQLETAAPQPPATPGPTLPDRDSAPATTTHPSQTVSQPEMAAALPLVAKPNFSANAPLTLDASQSLPAAERLSSVASRQSPDAGQPADPTLTTQPSTFDFQPLSSSPPAAFNLHPVKSPELARTAEAHPLQLVAQVAHGLESLTRSGQPSLRIQLYPENLGKIDLRVTSGVNGMKVTLLAETPATAALLSEHLPELRLSLADAGVALSGVSVGLGDAHGQNAHPGQQNQAGGANHPVLSPSGGQEDVPIEEDVSTHRLKTSSIVDYRV